MERSGTIEVETWCELDPDFVVLGKSLRGGVPTSAYGMTDDIAAFIERQGEPYEVAGSAVDEPAIGARCSGNALSMAATRAALAEVWKRENHARTQQLRQWPRPWPDVQHQPCRP